MSLSNSLSSSSLIPIENGYAIRFPDLPGTNSQGNDLANAIYMARDALAIWLDYLIDENEEAEAHM
ncbi:type II toxin-antitoxin system HicB family antitoxin [Desulfosporosinus nitroreducens]|uniref:type II toxin-antitoxin system HicB family antitoxin n=1 Tax=Desulfosporosinus nitroreducens TaxID=2018668 RepID=UPI00207CD84C|nr:type II toxin-antitoxin system HicB family antitoxin [Desulfosporosinus nitroreducens]MCO1604451.1 type II toxin-antitoxin system HicB family antitoxin [Desulfosporosinus nitroreducens]